MNNNHDTLEILTWYERNKQVISLKEFDRKSVSEDYGDIYWELNNYPRASQLVHVEEMIIDGKRHLIFSAGSKVGLEKTGPFTVFVSPKINDTDFLTMVNYAYDFQINLDKEAAKVEQKPQNLTAIFIKYFLIQLQKFLNHELKRSFVKNEQYLQSKIKGKVMLSPYLTSCVTKTKDTTIPCRFYEIQVDCLENQIIRYTAEIIRIVIPHLVLSTTFRKELIYLSNRVLQKMEAISFKRISPGDFNRIRYTGRFKNYRHIHELCQLMIQAAKTQMKAGKETFQGFSIDMNALFEKFITGVLKKETGLKVIPQKESKFLIENNIKGIRVDGWLPQQKLVFDTKYKEAFEPYRENDVTNLGPVKVLNTDIYQIIAYCNNHFFKNSTGVLVYPTSTKSPNGSSYYSVKGFNQSIYIISFNINFDQTRKKPKEINDFVATFLELINTHPDNQDLLSPPHGRHHA